MEAPRWGFPSALVGFPLTSLLSETSCLKELEHAGQQGWKQWFAILRLAGGGSEEAVCLLQKHVLLKPPHEKIVLLLFLLLRGAGEGICERGISQALLKTYKLVTKQRTKEKLFRGAEAKSHIYGMACAVFGG